MGKTPLPHDVYGAGYPLVLIHTESVDRRLWDYQIDAFASRFRVIRYDLRNHGRSPRCDGPHDADRDLLELLDELEVGAAHLVGAGAGGNIALEFALQYPLRVSALVLAGPGLSGNVPDPDEWRELAEGMAPMMGVFSDVQRGGDPAVLIDRLTALPTSPVSGAGRELLRQMLLDNAHLWTHPHRASARPVDPPAIGRLGEIGVPMLVMVGERDLGNKKRIAEILQHGIPGATKMIVAGAGEFPNLDDPEFFNDAVLRFLTALPFSPSATS